MSNESRNVDSPDFVIKNATYVEEKETEPRGEEKKGAEPEATAQEKKGDPEAEEKYILNQRIKKAEWKYEDALFRRVRYPEIMEFEHNVMKQYRRLWNYDHGHMLAQEGKDGKPDEYITMYNAQVDRMSEPELTASTTAVSAPEAEPPLQAQDAVVLAPRWGWPYNWPSPARFGGTASSPPRFGGTPGLPPWAPTGDTSQAPLGEPGPYERSGSHWDGWTCCGPHAEDPPWAESPRFEDVELPPIDSHLGPAASAQLGDVELPPIGQRAAAASTGCDISAPPLPGAESAASSVSAVGLSREGQNYFKVRGMPRR